MSCNTLTEILKDCNNNLGGITELYLTDIADLDTITIVDNLVTDLTLGGTVSFTKYEFIKNSATYEANGKVDRTGIIEFDHSISFKLAKRNAVLFTEAFKLIEGNRSLIALVKTRNDSYMLVGYEFGLVVTGIKGGSNATIGAGPTLDIAMKGKQKKSELQVDNTIAEGLI